MIQTRGVMAALALAGTPSTLLELTTRGDAVQDRAIAAIGTDNVFVTELEQALRERRADYAVHSCKDLPSALPADMTLAAITRREDPRDAFCSERYASFAELPAGARVGTSSPRRRAQLRALRDDLIYADVRGNVDTRLRKLREGQFDAIVLACAGLERLAMRATFTVPFAVDELTPAVGQGALAIETRAGDPLAAQLDAFLGDPAISLAVRAERAFLRTLRGGCRTPIGGHAAWGSGRLRLTGAIAAASGATVLRGSREAEIAVGDGRRGRGARRRTRGGAARRGRRRSARRRAADGSRLPAAPDGRRGHEPHRERAARGGGRGRRSRRQRRGARRAGRAHAQRDPLAVGRVGADDRRVLVRAAGRRPAAGGRGDGRLVFGRRRTRLAAGRRRTRSRCRRVRTDRDPLCLGERRMTIAERTRILNRPRRLRSSPAMRALVRETRVNRDGLVQPLFVVAGEGVVQPIGSMPGISRYSVDMLVRECRELDAVGVRGVLLFGIPDSADKDAYATVNSDPAGVVQRAARAIKDALPHLLVIADLCNCEYTDHGHCGILDASGDVDNDRTLEVLAKTALSYARAGVDVVAPSDMMDGRVAAIRAALDDEGFTKIAIMSYAAKYASAFYGPFREAAESTPSFGDRRTYQMDPANAREALKEVRLDIEEGADVVMVKPAMAYLDVVRRVREMTDLPVAVYHVSGEYAMLKAAAERGWIDEERAVDETLTAMARAGADVIITYFAKEYLSRARA